MLAGCSGESEATKRPLRVWAWGSGASALTDLANQYSRHNPASPVQVETLSRADLYRQLSNGLEAGGVNLPDIVAIESEQLPYYTHTFPEGFANLTGQTKPFVEGYLPPQLKAVSFLERVRAMPWTAGLTGLFYRTDILEKSGIQLAQLDTWDELIAAGTKFQANNPGLKMLVLDPTELFQILLYQQGLSFFSLDDKINLNSPQAIRAAKVLKELNDAGLVLPISDQAGRLDAALNGRVALVIDDLSFGNLLQARSVPLRDANGPWGVLPLPAVEKGGPKLVALNGLNLAITRSNGRESAAWPFLAFCQARAAATFQKFSLSPAYTPVYTDSFFSSRPPFFGGVSVWQIFAQKIPSMPPVLYNNEYARALPVVEQSLIAILAGADPSESLSKAARQLQQQTNRELAFK